MENEILDEPLDEEKSVSFFQPSFGSAERLIGFARLVVSFVTGAFLYFYWTRPSYSVELLNSNRVIVLMIASMIFAVTLFYSVPQAFKEIVADPSMLSKNRLRKFSLLLPIMVLAGMMLVMHHLYMSGVNPFTGFWLLVIVFLCAVGIFIRDINYIRKQTK